MEMEDIISKGLLQSAQDIFKKWDTISFLLCVPGLIFLKFVSHDYFKSIEELQKGYIDNFEFNPSRQTLPIIIPATASWDYILDRASDRKISTYLDEAMRSIEETNPSYKNILPKEYSSPNIDGFALSHFIKKLGQIPNFHHRTSQILSHVYDCIVRKLLLLHSPLDMREIVAASGSVLKLMVSLLGPERGKIFDPCCGIGSLLIESIRFIKEERKSLKEIKFYGQENRKTLFQLCCMHLAFYGIDITHMKWHSDISLNMDKHRNLKADFLLCAPPCKSKNSVLPWIEYAEAHLSKKGYAALLLTKDSLFIKKGNEPLIHKELLKTNRVDCIVNLPEMMSPIPGITLSILILAKDRAVKKGRHRYRNRGDEILFIDAASLPSITNLKSKEFNSFDIQRIVSVYHKWREKQGKTMEKKGFFKIIKIAT